MSVATVHYKNMFSNGSNKSQIICIFFYKTRHQIYIWDTELTILIFLKDMIMIELIRNAIPEPFGIIRPQEAPTSGFFNIRSNKRTTASGLKSTSPSRARIKVLTAFPSLKVLKTFFKNNFDINISQFIICIWLYILLITIYAFKLYIILSKKWDDT